MVKNKSGGSRHKKMARKNVKDYGRVMKMRYAGESEMYARVIKIYGQGNVDVMCNDKKVRLCVIRNKFRGRNKRDNMIKQDSMVLVGIREWQHMAANKKEKVDLLYIYSDSQIPDLKKTKEFNHDILAEISKDNEDDAVIFTHEEDDGEDSAFVFENTNHKVPLHKQPEQKNDDFDFDDI